MIRKLYGESIFPFITYCFQNDKFHYLVHVSKKSDTTSNKKYVEETLSQSIEQYLKQIPMLQKLESLGYIYNDESLFRGLNFSQKQKTQCSPIAISQISKQNQRCIIFRSGSIIELKEIFGDNFDSFVNDKKN